MLRVVTAAILPYRRPDHNPDRLARAIATAPWMENVRICRPDQILTDFLWLIYEEPGPLGGRFGKGGFGLTSAKDGL
jgi:hypothetical protein